MASGKHTKILSATSAGDYVVCGSDVGTLHGFNLKERFENQRERYLMSEESEIDGSASEDEVDSSGNNGTTENAMSVESESSPNASPSNEFCIPSACGTIYDMEFVDDGKLLACSGDDSINIWRWPSLFEHAGQPQEVVKPFVRLIPQTMSSFARGARAPIPEANSIACTGPSATQLLAGYGDSRVRIWDVASGKCIRVLTGTTKDAVYCVESITPHSVITGGEDGNVRTWDLRVSADRETSCTHIGGWVSCLSVSPSTNFAVCGGADASGKGGVLSVLYLAKQTPTASCNTASIPNALSFSRSSIAMVGSDSFVRRWGTTLGPVVSCAQISSRAGYCLSTYALTADQTALVTAGAGPFLDVFLLSCSRAMSIKIF